jgi:hypothetical protein
MKEVLGKKDVEINPASPLIRNVADLRVKDQDFAKELTEQIYDNAMIQAGLLVGPQQMVSRSCRIMERSGWRCSSSSLLRGQFALPALFFAAAANCRLTSGLKKN